VATALCIAGIMLAPSWLGLPLTVIVVGVLPGAAMTATLFGRRLELAEASVASIGISLATAVLGAVFLGVTVGLTRVSLVLLLGGVTLAAAALDLRSARPQRNVQGSEPQPIRPHISARATTIAVMTSLIVIAAVAWSVSYARTPLPARGVDGYTVLWIVRKGPRVLLAVRSQELQRSRYRLDVDDGSGHVRRLRIELAPGGRWGPLAAALPRAATVTATLYVRRGGTWVAYRRVRAVRD
jgi:hypothetical protein